MWRWLVIAAVFAYLLCATGVFIRNIGAKNFHHYRYFYEVAAIDALQWPRRLPELSGELWHAIAKSWEAA